MKERILKIEPYEEESLSGFSGYKITTSEQEIMLIINHYQQCCENYGYFMSEDNLDDYVGAELVDIKLTDAVLNTELLNNCRADPETADLYYYECFDTVFVDIITSKGVLQFVAYNEHNGWYGHDVIIKSKQLDLKKTL